MQRFILLHKTYSLLCLVCTTLFIAAPLSASAEPIPYRAVYKADYKGLPIGAEGVRELIKHDDGTYTLSSIASSFIAKQSESTRFKIEDGRLVPLHYEFHRSGIGKKRDAILDFDWQNHTVLNNVESRPWTMSIPKGTQDKLLYQLMMREDLIAAVNADKPWPELKYDIADGGKIKHYQFEVLGIEEIKTPVGQLKTLKIRRIGKAHHSIFWLSMEHHFLLVRLQQQKENGSGFELNLRAAEFNGQPI